MQRQEQKQLVIVQKIFVKSEDLLPEIELKDNVIEMRFSIDPTADSQFEVKIALDDKHLDAIYKDQYSTFKQRYDAFNVPVHAFLRSSVLLKKVSHILITATNECKNAYETTKLKNHALIKEKLKALQVVGKQFMALADEWKSKQPYIFPQNDALLKEELQLMSDELNEIVKVETSTLEDTKSALKSLNESLASSFQARDEANILIKNMPAYIQKCLDTSIPVAKKAKSILKAPITARPAISTAGSTSQVLAKMPNASTNRTLIQRPQVGAGISVGASPISGAGTVPIPIAFSGTFYRLPTTPEAIQPQLGVINKVYIASLLVKHLPGH